MKKNYIFFTLFILLFFPLSGKADLCAYLDKNAFDKAYDILLNTTEYIAYCPLCDDATAKLNTVQKISFMQLGEDIYEIYINDAPVDIAYTYVDGKNVGLMAGCSEIYKLPGVVDVLNAMPPVKN